MTPLPPIGGAFAAGDPPDFAIGLDAGFDAPALGADAWPGSIADARPSAPPRRSLPIHEARHAALDLARDVLEGAGRSPHGHRSVSRALEQLGDRYRRAVERDEPAARQALEALGNRLIDLARDARMLTAGHSDFATMAARRPPAKREATAPSPLTAPPPPPTPPPAQAPPTPPPAQAPPTPSSPPAAAPAVGATVGLTARSFVSPSGTGANGTLSGRLFVGATLREGAGAPPASWTGVPTEPYREVFAGWSTSDLIFDAAGRLDALQPRFVTGYASGDGRSSLGLQLWRDLEPDAAGRRAVGAQATYATLGPDGKPRTRIDLQVASPPSVPDATPRVAGRAEQFVQMGGSALRLRATAAHSGVPGQTVGVTGSVAIDPPPSIGTFPGGPRGAPMKPSLELAASHVPAPLPGRPGRATDTVAVTAGLASPDAVLTATVSRARTDDATQVRASGTAMVRLGRNDIGDPPTTVTAGGVDPIGMPTGRYPAGARGANTTAYARFAVTLADDGPPPQPGASVPGRDSITVGVAHTRTHGPVAGAYVQGTADVTPRPEAAKPAERVAVTAGVHLRPDDDVPVTIHVSANVGTGGDSVSAGVVVMPDRNTAIEAGARFDVDRSEVQPYAKVRIRL